MKRDYQVIETNSNDPGHIARLTKDIKDAQANIPHDRERDPEDHQVLVDAGLGNVDIEVSEERDPVTNCARYYLVIAPKGQVKKSLEDHKARWHR